VSAFGSRVMVDERLRAEIGCMSRQAVAGIAHKEQPRERGRDLRNVLRGAEERHREQTSRRFQIQAHRGRRLANRSSLPGAKIRHIKPFKSKAEIDEWLQGTRRADWLRSGYAK
jgi:hypothetical protein